MKRRNRVSVLVCISLLVAALGLAGCQSAADKAADKAAEAIVEDATGADVDIDENKVTIEGEDGSSVEVQSGEELPEDYPDDAPVYDAAIASSGKIAVDGSTSWTITQTTTDSYDVVVDDLHKQLADAGWQESGSTDSDSGGMKVAIIVASKGDSQCSVGVQQDEGEDVEISITVNE